MNSILTIFSFTRKFWLWYAAMGLFVLSISLLSLGVPLLSKQVVDAIVQKIGGGSVEFSRLLGLFAGIIAIDITVTTFTAIGQHIGDILGVRLTTYLMSEYYRHVLHLHIGYYDQEVTGKIANKMYRGITSITRFIQEMLNNFLPFMMTAVVTIVLLAQYSPIIAVLLAVLFPTYILISHRSSLTWREREAVKNELQDVSQGRVFESLAGIRIVRSFATELLELGEFLRTRKRIEQETVVQSRGWHWYDFARRLALNIILFAIYAYIAYWTFHERFTLGEMTLLLQLVNQARFPLFAMSYILGQIQEAGEGSKDFFQVLSTENQIQDAPHAKPILIPERLTGKPMIEFRDVAFAYEGGKEVLRNVSFQLKQGEKLALVGESGQGKSTLVNLLLRYYAPSSGSIFAAGQDISQVTQRSVREQIAVVFQESLLFSGTVAENIRYAKPNASQAEVERVAKAANAHDFILQLPQGYETSVGERGIKLSGGQKQRIAIARAMLKDAPIIILDEATSALDSKAELEVQKGLEELLKNRTSIVIAHRLSTVASADHVLVLAGGTVAEFGTAQALLQKKHGLYAELVELQQNLLRLPGASRKGTNLEKFELVG